MGLRFTIGEVADLLRITPKTIRHYHKIGLLDEPARDANNYRYYSLEDIERIQHILRLKSFGLSLKQIAIITQSNQQTPLLHTVLQEQEQNLRREIAKINHQLDNIHRYLDGDPGSSQVSSNQSGISSSRILADSIKPISNGLSDILIEIEVNALNKIDSYQWHQDYPLFVHETGKQIARQIITSERLFIFWMERYLALGTMADDDLQAQAWLEELHQTSAYKLIGDTLKLPLSPNLPDSEQARIQKLLIASLFDNTSTVQKKFLYLLLNAGI